jgi:hypothetical protein
VASERTSDVERGDVAGPHNAEEKDHQGGAVVLGTQGRQGDQREAGIKQAKDCIGGIRNHARYRAGEGADQQQNHAENPENRSHLVRPLKSARKQRGDRDHHDETGGIRALPFCEAEIFPTSQGGYQGGGQRKQPLPSGPKKHEKQDQRNQNYSREDAFHSWVENTARG